MLKKFAKTIRKMNNKSGTMMSTVVAIIVCVALSATVLAGLSYITTNSAEKAGDKAVRMLDINEASIGETVKDLNISSSTTKISDYLHDGLTKDYYYSSIEKAIIDINNHKIENNDSTKSEGVFSISVRTKDDVYVIKPLKQTVVKGIKFENTCIFDINGQNVAVASAGYIGTSTAADIVFRDNGKNKGCIKKEVLSDKTEYLFASAGGITTFASGKYQLNNSGTGISVGHLVADGIVNVDNMSFVVDSKGSSINACFYLQGNGSLAVVNGNFSCKAENGKSYTINTTKTSKGSLTIVGGNFSAYGKSLTMNINAGGSGSIVISNGTFVADNINATADECDTTACSVLFTYTSTTSPITISGGKFSARREALSLSSSGPINITGGIFEGVQHGGAYFSSSNAIMVKNATFQKWTDYDGICDASFNACFYMGSKNSDVSVYMDNCILKGGRAVLSSNYDYKNTNLYISNTSINEPIRIDSKGKLFLGKNASYSGLYNTVVYLYGQGIVDETTYSDKVFVK